MKPNHPNLEDNYITVVQLISIHYVYFKTNCHIKNILFSGDVTLENGQLKLSLYILWFIVWAGGVIQQSSNCSIKLSTVQHLLFSMSWMCVKVFSPFRRIKATSACHTMICWSTVFLTLPCQRFRYIFVKFWVLCPSQKVLLRL